MSEAHAHGDLRLKRSSSQRRAVRDPLPEYWSKDDSRWHLPPAHQGVRRDATLPHRLTASCQTEGLSCGRLLLAHACEMEQTYPGVAQAAS